MPDKLNKINRTQYLFIFNFYNFKIFLNFWKKGHSVGSTGPQALLSPYVVSAGVKFLCKLDWKEKAGRF